MKRRALLSTLALGLSGGCLGALPRPTGPRGPPEEPASDPREPRQSFSIETWDFGETESGLLRVFGTVRNTSDASATTTVTATVSIEGDTDTKTVEVTVSAESTAHFGMVFEVEYDRFASNGSLNIDLGEE